LLLEGGVVVAEVAQDSPAWRAGLRPEMVISHVGSTHVETPKDFQAATSERMGSVTLREVRLGAFQIERPTHTIEAD
jgi:S1-C subfamily serine protease